MTAPSGSGPNGNSELTSDDAGLSSRRFRDITDDFLAVTLEKDNVKQNLMTAIGNIKIPDVKKAIDSVRQSNLTLDFEQDGKPVLWHAVASGSTEIVKLLLSEGKLRPI